MGSYPAIVPIEWKYVPCVENVNLVRANLVDTFSSGYLLLYITLNSFSFSIYVSVEY